MTPRTPPDRLLEGGADDAAGHRTRSLLVRLPQLAPRDRLSQERGWRQLSAARRRAPANSWRLVPAAAAAAVLAVAGASWIRWGARPAELAGPGELIALPRARVLLVGLPDVTVASLAPDTVLQLRRGEVILSVDPRRPGEHFAVQTARYRVTVKGTIFSVQERTEDDVEVSVSRGRVEVTGEGGRWEVGAGERWRSRQPSERDQDNVPVAARVRLEAAAPAAAPEPPALAQVAAQAPTPQPMQLPLAAIPPPARRPMRPELPEAPRLARLDPRPAPQAASVSPPLPPPPAPVATATGLGPEVAASPASAVPAVAPPAPVAPVVVSHPDLALYELARARQQAGDVAGALEAYGRYGREYPEGPLAQEAAVSEIELTLERHALAAAAAEIDRFLARHGESERAAEMHLRRGDLRRAQGDARGALRDYGISARTGAGDVADDAAYLVAVCDEQLARTEDAAAASHDYLRRFPAGRHAAAVRAALGNDR